tara:strand:+ start:1402 stop:1971 length:570 start_codon:yes stop_codon:yes gene_type:complete
MSYIGEGTNAGNPVLVATTTISSATASVTFDGVFKGYTNHYKLIIVDLTVDNANCDVRTYRRLNGSDVTTEMDTQLHAGVMAASGATNVETNATTSGLNQFDRAETGSDSTRHTLSAIADYFPNVANMPSTIHQSLSIGAGSNSLGSDDDAWWFERANTLIGSTAFDGIRIHTSEGSILSGKFYIYAMV